MTKQVYTKYKVALNNFPKEIEEEMEAHTEGNQMFWFFEDWKWYSSYDDITRISDFLTLLEKDEEDETFAFVRVGEEYGDKEELGDPSMFDIWVDSVLQTPVKSL